MADQDNHGVLDEETINQILEQQAVLILGPLQEFTNLDADTATTLAMSVSREQLDVLNQIMPTTQHGDEALVKFPRFGVKIQAPNGTSGQITAPKRLEDVTDPGEALHWAFVLSLILCPQARACLKAFGFNYAFVQAAKQTESKSRIIV